MADKGRNRPHKQRKAKTHTNTRFGSAKGVAVPFWRLFRDYELVGNMSFIGN